MGKFWRYFAIVTAVCFFSLNLVLFLVFVPFGSPENEPAETVQQTKQKAGGEEGPDDKNPPARVVCIQLDQDLHEEKHVVKTSFSKPMISPYFVGSVFTPPTLPISFTPSLKGFFKWETPTVLNYYVEDASIPREVKAELSSHLTDAAGNKLQGRRSFTLDMVSLSFLSVEQEGLAKNGNPVLRLRFNTPVLPTVLDEYLVIAKGDDAIGYTMLGRSAGRVLRLVLREPVGGQLKLTVNKGCKGVNFHSLVSPLARSVAVTADLILNNITKSEVGGNHFRVELHFNDNVRESLLRRYFDINPPVSVYVSFSYGHPSLIGKFRPGRSYELKVRKGLRSLNGMELKETVVKQLHFPDLRPDIKLTGEGFYLPGDAELTIPVQTINTEKFRIQVERLYENNIVWFAQNMYTNRINYYFPSYVSRELPDEEIQVEGPWNKWITTDVDIEELVGQAPRGVFAVRTVLHENHWRSRRTVLQITDLGITAKQSDKNCVVWVSSLKTSKPVEGAAVTLLSRTNQVVARRKTNGSGLVFFDGPFPYEYQEQPFIVTAASGDDTAFLHLDSMEITSTQRLPGGRSYLDEGYEAFLWSERGVYRPEEEIHLYTIVRDRRMESPDSFPIRFRLVKPDGREWKVLKADLSDVATGMVTFSVPRFMPTGNYRAEVLNAADSVIGSTSLLVEEIRPDRMKVDVTVSPQHLVAGETAEITVSAFHFFGKKASEKKVDGIMKFRSCGFSPDAYRKYRFYSSEDRRSLSEKTMMLGTKTLDNDGKVKFMVDLPRHPLPPARFLAQFSFTVREEGGRSVTAQVSKTVDPYPVYLGIVRQTPRPTVGLDAYFNIKALTARMKPADLENVVVQLYKEDYTHAYEQGSSGSWEWRSAKEHIKVGCYPVACTKGDAVFSFTPDLAGRYIIKVEAGETKHITSLSFRVAGSGWSSRSFLDPAQVKLTADKPVYKAGDTASIEVISPFDGTLFFTLEGDRIHDAHVLDVACGVNTVEVPITGDYWPNFYCTAHIVRPYWPVKHDVNLTEEKTGRKAGPVPAAGTEKGTPEKAIEPAEEKEPEKAPSDTVPEKAPEKTEEPEPAPESEPAPDTSTPSTAPSSREKPQAETVKRPYRAYGILPISLDKTERAVSVALTVPDTIKPGQELAVEAKTTYDGKPLQSEVVLALVDEGLLSLTAERPPSPLGFFGSLRTLDCITSDLYSYLVPCRALAPGGGSPADEGLARKRLNPIQYKTEKPVAFFYPPKQTDAGGLLKVTLPAPDFAGSLRVVALAVTGDKVGAAHTSCSVKPDVIVRPTFPRCLAQGDEALLPLVFFNNLKEEKQLSIKVAADGPVEPVEDREVTVPGDGETVLRLPVKAKDAFGPVTFTISVEGDGVAYTKTHQLPVRPPWSSAALTGSIVLVKADQPASLFELAQADGRVPDFFAGTEEVQLVVSPSPLAEFAAAARYLICYPYGCGEQTTSALLGLAVARKMDLKDNTVSVDAYIAEGIQRLAAKQTESGGIAMWRSYQRPVLWLSAYAGHVLTTLKEGHELLLQDVLEELLVYLEDNIFGDDQLDSRAYAGFVCALSGRDVRAQLLRFAEKKLSVRAIRLTACALTLAGEKKAADRLLRREYKGKPDYLYLLSETVEDAIEVITAVKAGNIKDAKPVINRLKKAAAKYGRWRNTHECAWALLALTTWAGAQGFDASSNPSLALSVKDKNLFSGTLKETKTLSCSLDEFKQITSAVSDGTAFLSWSVSGVPKEMIRRAERKDFRVMSRFYDFRGNEVKDTFELGTAYVGEIEFASLSSLDDVVVSALLPGGFEIENPRLQSTVHADIFDDRTLYAEHVGIRDDRLLLFMDIPQTFSERETRDFSSRPRRYRYIVRAVSEGAFILPPVEAECMYDPDVQSATAGGTIKVVRK